MVTADETADRTIALVCARYFPDYLPPPGRGDERYDPLVTAIHHAAEAIGRLDDWIQHIRETGPHDTKTCPQCGKLCGLVRENLRYADARAGEGYNHQFIRCKRAGCGGMFRPIHTRKYCSDACRQAAYRARRVAGHGQDHLPADTVPFGEPWPEPWRDIGGVGVQGTQ